jgi:uncharacterized protein (DUF305 family)
VATPARLAALVGGLTLALTLSACGDGASSTSGSGAPPAAIEASEISQEHNAADVEFTQQMIPHHRQATEMAELAPDRAESEDVKALAEEIIAAQQPEIETMTAMLARWGQPMSGDGSGDVPMGGMDMGGMTGMMTPQQMTELENASGAEFDRSFLQMMIAHHKGAVEMARAEQVDGQNPQAIELAKQIESAQIDEIARMQGLLPVI